jgi:4'-phosphopantetheinyl transferase
VTLSTLAPDGVHLWVARAPRCNSDALRDRYLPLLSDAERQRMQGFRFDHLRHRFLLTRALCRTTLSRYVDVAPEAWRFEAGAHGRPALTAPFQGYDLHFNLSHAADVIVCAVARIAEVGVDVESTTRVKDDTAIADRYFAPAEAADVRTAAADRSRRFFRYWTLKEAYVKARGQGLTLPLDAFTMHLDAEPIRIAFDARIDDDAATWRFAQDWLDDTHLLALAMRMPSPPAITMFEVVPGDAAAPTVVSWPAASPAAAGVWSRG